MSLSEICDYREYTFKPEADKALSTLNGLLQGIVIDKKIDDLEISELVNWCITHQDFRKVQPFKEIIEIIESSLEDNIVTDEEFRNIMWVINKCSMSNGYYDIQTKAIQTLEGVLHGILANNKITDGEVFALRDWLDEYDFLKGLYPYDEIYSLVVSVLEDGVVTSDEKCILKSYFTNFIETEYSANININEIDKLRKDYCVSGICAIEPDIVFENKGFCFTGSSDKVTRSDFKEKIENIGGFFSNKISRKIDYLVVGAKGSPCWAYSCYGRKIEEATTLRKSGHNINIIHENDFWDCYENAL